MTIRASTSPLSETLTDAQYQAKRRKLARANRLCGVCCKKPAPESYRCEDCARKLSEQPARVERRSPPADSFCIDCQAHGRHRADCPTQRKERAA